MIHFPVIAGVDGMSDNYSEKTREIFSDLGTAILTAIYEIDTLQGQAAADGDVTKAKLLGELSLKIANHRVAFAESLS